MNAIHAFRLRALAGFAVAFVTLALIGAGSAPADLLEVSHWSGSGDTWIERDSQRLEFSEPKSAGAGWRRVDAPDGVVILVESVGLSGDTPAVDDNDYTRIKEGIAAAVVVGEGTTVRLAGTFDWTETFANAAWVADDYGILMPGGVDDITITATALGNAVIQGPGELPDVYWETFLQGWGTTYQGWTISNLDVRGFEWTFAFYYAPGTGSIDDFDGLSIVGNRIEVPADGPAISPAWESMQNAALHLGFGDHQTIAGNEIVLAGTGVSDTANNAGAASVVLQANSSGGPYEDGLLIADNLIRVTGAQSADPEYLYGIWENFGANTSNLTVAGNRFLNENAGNDPALNRQLGFRITSHSSATTTVAFTDNTVVGAHTGIGWLKYSSPYNPPVTVEPVVVRGNTLLDCATGVWVRSDNGNGKGTLVHNRYWQTPIGVHVENATATSIDWWGCNGGPNATGCADATTVDSGALDAASWLAFGIENLPGSAEVGAAVSVEVVLRETLSDAIATTFPPAPVVFAATPPSITSPHDTDAGVAEAIYTPAAAGIAQISATLDATTVQAQLLVTQGGIVTVSSIAETASTPNSADNDYTRINNMLQAVDDDVTVRLVGTFDWTEPFADASWQLGSDGVDATGDEYGILPPFGFQNVTLDAATLGDAIIQGPGDLPGVNLEAFLAMWGGTYKDWTFARLDIRGFDLAIGMFCCDGADSSNQYDGVAVIDNRIELPVDWNSIAAPVDSNQNIGIHFAFGDHQTIQGNEIVIPGTGVSDTSAPDPINWRYSSSVGMQSNTSGGAVYEGLLIADNLVRVTGVQSADPERVIGIWENGHNHVANLTVSGNRFLNENAGNDPAANGQRGFRLTSHSSATTEVLYEGNRVTGANIALEMPYDPPATAEPIVVRSNDLEGNGTGLLMTMPNQKVDSSLNRLVENLVGVDAQDGLLLAENNWWGCNAGPGSAGCDGFTVSVDATVDANPWLTLTLAIDDPIVVANASTGVTAALVWNSDLVDTSLGGFYVPDGIPAAFAATGGTVAPSPVDTLEGEAASVFTAGAVGGNFQVSVTVDGETVNTGVVVQGDLLSDDFETGDFSRWSEAVGEI